MAVAKSEMERKREKRRIKREKIDKLTNWYMINLSWGVLGIIALSFVENLFGNAETILSAPVIMKVVGVVFAALAIAIFAVSRLGKFKNTKRATNYSIFMGVIALISLWIGFYANIRSILISVIPALSSLRSEWWYVWGFRYLIAIYLIAAFVVVTVKTALYAKGK